MTSKSQLRPDGPVAPRGLPYSSPEPSPATGPQKGGNFFSLISEALAKAPAKAAGNAKYTKGPSASTFESGQAAQAAKAKHSAALSESRAKDSRPTTSDAAEDSAQNPADETKTASDVDTSVSNMMMALLAQSPLTTKVVPAPTIALKAEGDADTELTDAAKSTDQTGSKQTIAGQIITPGSVDPKTAGLSALLQPTAGCVEKTVAAAASEAKLAKQSDLKAESTLQQPDQTDSTDKSDVVRSALQPIILERLMTPVQGLEPPDSGDGTGAALNKQRMKNVSEKIEIAGRTLQKLPRLPLGDDISAGLAGETDFKVDSDTPGRKQDFSGLTPMMDFAAKPVVSLAEQGGAMSDVSKVDSQAQVDRISRLVTQEVVTIRQSGANSLAVSLKVDQHTEVLLQLTNHGGQIQASIRCERGNQASLDSHWGQLQESLAKQNVQLMPLEGKGSTNNSPFNSFSHNSQNSPSGQFDQASQNPRRETRNLQNELVMADGSSKPVRSRTTKSRTTSPDGWESWA